MPASLGRNVRIEKSADGNAPWVTVAGARSDSFTVTRDTVDITDKDINGWRSLLGEVPNVAVDLTVSGVLKDETLIVDSLNPNTSLFHYRITFESFTKSATGLWALSNVEVTAETNDVTTFSAQLMSSGVIVWANS